MLKVEPSSCRRIIDLPRCVDTPVDQILNLVVGEFFLHRFVRGFGCHHGRWQDLARQHFLKVVGARVGRGHQTVAPDEHRRNANVQLSWAISQLARYMKGVGWGLWTYLTEYGGIAYSKLRTNKVKPASYPASLDVCGIVLAKSRSERPRQKVSAKTFASIVFSARKTRQVCSAKEILVVREPAELMGNRCDDISNHVNTASRCSSIFRCGPVIHGCAYPSGTSYRHGG